MLGDDGFLCEVMAQCGEPVRENISIERMIDVVYQAYGIKAKELCGPSRKRLLAEARGVTGWLLTETGQYALAALAKKMRRDSSALSLMTKKTRERASADEMFAERLKQIRNNSITHA